MAGFQSSDPGPIQVLVTFVFENLTVEKYLSLSLSLAKIVMNATLQASGQVRVGDTLVSCNGFFFPGPSGFKEDLAALKAAAYPIALEFQVCAPPFETFTRP